MTKEDFFGDQQNSTIFIVDTNVLSQRSVELAKPDEEMKEQQNYPFFNPIVAKTEVDTQRSCHKDGKFYVCMYDSQVLLIDFNMSKMDMFMKSAGNLYYPFIKLTDNQRPHSIIAHTN